jgi:hypothetical protein
MMQIPSVELYGEFRDNNYVEISTGPDRCHSGNDRVPTADQGGFFRQGTGLYRRVPSGDRVC